MENKETKSIRKNVLLSTFGVSFHTAAIVSVLGNVPNYDFDRLPLPLTSSQFAMFNALAVVVNTVRIQWLIGLFNGSTVKERVDSKSNPIEQRLAGGPRPTPRPGSTRSSHLEMLAMIDGEKARRVDDSTPEDVLTEVLRYKRPEVAGRIVEQVYSNAIVPGQNPIDNSINKELATV